LNGDQGLQQGDRIIETALLEQGGRAAQVGKRADLSFGVRP
jgi:hypothetical protein